MSQDSQDLFNVMDSALKRQNEGQAPRFRAPGEERPAQAEPAKPASQRLSAPAPAPAQIPAELNSAPVPGQPVPVAPPMPVAPAAPAAPAPAPVQSQAPAQVPAPAAPQEPSEPTIKIPEFPGYVEGQPTTREITRRLYPMPDMARTAPAGGSLSPGQVLRGTVFSGNRFRPGPQQSGSQEPPTSMPPPIVAEQQQQQQQQPPPAPLPPVPAVPAVPPTSSPASSRQSPVRSVASATLRARPSAAMTPQTRTSTTYNAPVPPSNRYESGPSAPQSGGFFVRTEMAGVVVIVVVMALVGTFFLGHTMGESSAQRKSGRPSADKPLPIAAVPKPIPDLDGPGNTGTPIQSNALPTPEQPKPTGGNVTTPPTAGVKYYVRVRGYSASERSAAEKLAEQLKGKHFPDVRIAQEGGLSLVLTGRVDSQAEAEQLMQRAIKEVQLPKGSKPLVPQVLKAKD